MAEGFAQQQQQQVQAIDFLVEKTPNAFGANSYFNQHWDELLNWNPPDPGMCQKQYSDEELELEMVGFDAEFKDHSPMRNNFINDEAREDDYTNDSSNDIREIGEYLGHHV